MDASHYCVKSRGVMDADSSVLPKTTVFLPSFCQSPAIAAPATSIAAITHITKVFLLMNVSLFSVGWHRSLFVNAAVFFSTPWSSSGFRERILLPVALYIFTEIMTKGSGGLRARREQMARVQPILSDAVGSKSDGERAHPIRDSSASWSDVSVACCRTTLRSTLARERPVREWRRCARRPPGPGCR